MPTTTAIEACSTAVLFHQGQLCCGGYNYGSGAEYARYGQHHKLRTARVGAHELLWDGRTAFHVQRSGKGLRAHQMLESE